MKSIFRKLYWLARRPQREAELHEELQFHLEEETQQRREDGDDRNHQQQLDQGKGVIRRAAGRVATLRFAG